jgi:hypothetical protein
VTLRDAIDDDDRAFIVGMDMLFLATAESACCSSHSNARSACG